MKDDKTNKSTSTNHHRDDFEILWERRQQWQEQVEKSVPDDEALLRWAEKAKQTSIGREVNVIPFPSHHRNRWIPYAAVACIAVGVAVVGLNRQDETDSTLPVAEEVKVGEQTIRFLCNNGCSVQEVMLSANEVIK